MFYYVPAVVKVQLFVHNVLKYLQIHSCNNVTIQVERNFFNYVTLYPPFVAAPCTKFSYPMSLHV